MPAWIATLARSGIRIVSSKPYMWPNGTVATTAVGSAPESPKRRASASICSTCEPQLRVCTTGSPVVPEVKAIVVT